MTIQEIAQEYDVPMPETSKEMNWQGKTNFYWQEYETKSGINYALYFRIGITNYEVASNFDSLFAKAKGQLIPAPIAKQIAPLLPRDIVRSIKTKYKAVFEGHNQLETHTWFCKDGESRLGYNQDFKVKIDNHHFAQAYAELYLKVKSENLLKNG